MSLEALKAELRKKTSAEVLRIENEGKLEAKRIKDEAKRAIETQKENARKEAEEFIGRENMRIPAARLRARRIISDAKFEMVASAIREVSAMLEEKAKNRKEYEKLLEKMILQGQEEVGEKNTVILVRRQDLQFAKKFGKAEEFECLGGALVLSSDGKTRINNTLEALLEKNNELLQEKAFELMFSKGSK